MKKIILLSLMIISSSLMACDDNFYDAAEFILRVDSITVLGQDQTTPIATLPTTPNLKFQLPSDKDRFTQVIDQQSDEGGIISTTYGFFYTQSQDEGKAPLIMKIKITSNYTGNGVWTKDCGSVDMIY